MKRFVSVLVCFVALLLPVAVLANGAQGFDGIVQSLESRYHVKATRIPFMGLISMISRRASGGAAGNIHVAEFDNFAAPLDGEEINRMVEEKLGLGWERVVRETSRNGSSQTLVFMHPEGQRMGLFVLDADGHELDIVQMSVDPNHLNEKIQRYQHHSRGDEAGASGGALD